MHPFARYAEELAASRVLKHSSESANGKCGENLAWASYDQPGKLPSLAVSHRHHINSLFHFPWAQSMSELDVRAGCKSTAIAFTSKKWPLQPNPCSMGTGFWYADTYVAESKKHRYALKG